MSVDTNSLEHFTETVRGKVTGSKALGATIKFAFTDPDGGVLYLDGNDNNTIHNNDVPAQCTIKVSRENFGKLLSKQLDPTMAFMGGKIKVEGDMGVAMKLGKVFT